ncbi:MAG: hypothetical protein WBA74_10710, partial [Cyclobacteriaceae bacterium]
DLAGNLTAFDPQLPGGGTTTASSMALEGQTLYVGADDVRVIDLSSGQLIDIDPVVGVSSSYRTINTIAPGPNSIYIGGDFKSVGGTERKRFAAFTISTGELTPMDIGANGAVRDMILDGNTLYFGGSFSSLDGVPRNGIASLNLTTETVNSWHPNALTLTGDPATVHKMIIKGTNMYVGGDFRILGGETRFLVAELDLGTGFATDWNPNSDGGRVNDLAVSGDTLFVAGSFPSRFGDEFRRRLASVVISTGELTSWAPLANSEVHAIAVGNNGNVYVGGSFSAIGSDSRSRLAAIDPVTGVPTSWNPIVSSTVDNILTTDENIIYVSGRFRTINSIERLRVAAFEESDGSLIDWSLDVLEYGGGGVASVVVSGANVFLGATSEGLIVGDNLNFTAVSRVPGPVLGITLDNTTVDENSEIGTVVGTLTAIDEPDTHVYELVSGTGDDDNALFQIDGDLLKTNGIFDFETRDAYSVRIKVTDGQASTFEETFTISVNNVIEEGNAILSFSYQGELSPAVIDEERTVIYTKVPFGTNFNTLIPTFEISSGATVNFPSGTPRNFFNRTNTTYTVTSESGIAENWTVVVSTPLPGGTYSVKTGGDFTNLQTAFLTISGGGILGDVVLEITGDHFASTFILNRYDGTEEHSLTIRPADDAGPLTLSGSSTATIFQINGVENLLFDGEDKITLTNNRTGGAMRVRRDFNGDDSPGRNVTIKNITFIAQASGIGVNDTYDVVIENNKFFSKANTNEDFYYGIRVQDVDQPSDVTIRNNIVSIDEQFNSSNGSITGIQTGETNGDVSIYNNVVAIAAADLRGVRGIVSTSQVIIC